MVYGIGNYLLRARAMAQHEWASKLEVNRPRWFTRSWGSLAKSVLEEAFADLDPQGENHNLNKPAMKASAQRFFESRRFRVWAKAAGISVGDVEEAYISMLDKTQEM